MLNAVCPSPILGHCANNGGDASTACIISRISQERRFNLPRPAPLDSTAPLSHSVSVFDRYTYSVLQAQESESECILYIERNREASCAFLFGQLARKRVAWLAFTADWPLQRAAANGTGVAKGVLPWSFAEDEVRARSWPPAAAVAGMARADEDIELSCRTPPALDGKFLYHTLFFGSIKLVYFRLGIYL